MRSQTLGALLVACAAMLWASDGLVRYPLVQKGFDPLWLVLIDHLICSTILLPIAWSKQKKNFFRLKPAQWAAVFFLGGGASAIATLFFTASFRHVNPSVSILLQKLQPVFVVLLAMAFLKERPRGPFWIWAGVALIAGLVLSFPDLDFSFAQGIALQSKGPLLAVSAAVLWGLATVVGKGVLFSLPPLVVTTWRYVFGLVTLAWVVLISGTAAPALSADPSVIPSIAYVSLIPGLLAMILYYFGMVRTTASTTTFMELLFPVSAVALNTIFLKTPISGVQAVAALVLLFSVTQISVGESKSG